MTPYYHAWIELIQQRDKFYLLIFLATLVCYGWYRFALRRFFKLAAAACLVVVGLGLLWGLWHLPKG